MRRSASCLWIAVTAIFGLLDGSCQLGLAQVTAVRDAQAVRILTQCSAALGDPNTFMGLNISGVLERGDSNTQFPFLYQARGVTSSKFTVQMPSGSEIHLQNGGHAQVRLANGSLRAKPDTAARYQWPQLIPALICYWPLADTSFSIRYVESTITSGAQTDHLHIHAVIIDSNGNADSDEALLSGIEIYLDSTTHLPVRTTVRAFGNTGIQNSIPVDSFYSNYGRFQGLLFPSTITEYSNYSLNRTITIQSVAIGQVFTDADFAMEQPQ